jgi:hypothetical protein
MKKLFIALRILLTLMVLHPFHARAWSEHPMIVYPILRDMPEMVNAPKVVARSLQQFLMEEEAGLAAFLAEHEEWAREHIPHYAFRPDELAFSATGNDGDILQRFYGAIRINPNVKMALYMHLLPGEDCGTREYVNPYELTTLSKLYEMLFATYIQVDEGDSIAPLYVMATATDEPDYGFDLGLFTDNDTWWGKTYGFGEQSFGNPKLEYGSQAPFHMGFYHESGLVFAAAPFLRRTYVEYRIHLYRSLANYAFSKKQDYWGWRFLGWATHYLNDMSMPYHTSVMPAKGPLAMIWINLKAMLGFPRSRDKAVQLLSNRHTVYEHFQWIALREAHLANNQNHPFIQALLNPVDHLPYNDEFARNVAAKESAKVARKHDRRLRRSVPSYLVSDPKHAINSSEELEGLLQEIKEEKGEDAVEDMTDMIASRFRSLSMHTRSFVLSALDENT